MQVHTTVIISSLLILLSVSIGRADKVDSTAGQIFYTKGGVVYGSPYHFLADVQFLVQLLPDKNAKIARLSLDADLGWIYFTSLTDKLIASGSRYNYLLKNMQPLIPFVGQGDPWTRPSFVLDLDDNLLFWTGNSNAMRSISNGAQPTQITNSTMRVEGLAYDQARKNINLIKLTTKGDYYTYDLYTMNIDGSNQLKIGLLNEWSYRAYPSMSIITVHDGLVFVGYTAYYLQTSQNILGVYCNASQARVAPLWISEHDRDLITDIAYDPKSRSLVWILQTGQIWKGQLNSDSTKLVDATVLLNDTSLGEGIMITQSSCDFNCYLNGACSESTKQCKCAPNYFPSTTCKTFCTREETCSGHGSCSSADGSCICDLNWEGSRCNEKKKSPPIFPNAFVAKNVTISGPNSNAVTATVAMYQPLQLQRFDWSNGTTTILRYDLGFRFDLFKGSCNTSILGGLLPQFRVPADAVLNGTTACAAPSPCNIWWSAKDERVFYTTRNPSPSTDGDLPVLIKDYKTLLVTSYDVLLFNSNTPDKSLFDFPTTCLPKIN